MYIYPWQRNKLQPPSTLSHRKGRGRVGKRQQRFGITNMQDWTMNFSRVSPSYRPCTFCKSASLMSLLLYQECLAVQVRCPNHSAKTVELQYPIHIKLYDLSRLLEILLENWTCRVYYNINLQLLYTTSLLHCK